MKRFILLSILSLIIITISGTVNLHAQLIGGSPLCCKINNGCGEASDVGSMNGNIAKQKVVVEIKINI